MTRLINIITVLFFIFVTIPANSNAERKYLFKWDEGLEHNMPGWVWSYDVAYENQGWYIDDSGYIYTRIPGEGDRFFPETIQKHVDANINNKTNAEIIINDRAPSTISGGALKLSDEGSVYQAGWWVWSDVTYLSKEVRSVTMANGTDRLSYYIKVDTDSSLSEDNTGTYFHFATYLCGDDEGIAGASCPDEGPGNLHFYHYSYYSPGFWIHQEIDRHPTHLREVTGGHEVAGDNPVMIIPTSDDNGTEYFYDYFGHLKQFYMEIRDPHPSPTSFIVDEMYFYSTSDPDECSEPNQNDASVTTLWVGYNAENGKWQIGWQDMSYMNTDGDNLNDNTNSTFIIKWLPSPITNANFNLAYTVHPEWNTYPTHTSVIDGVRRQSSYYPRAWTQFDLPPGTEDNYNHIYFAVKDVSVAGSQNAGTTYPWNRDDGHDAPTSNIKTIDYYVRPDSSETGVFNCGPIPIIQAH